MDSEEHLEESLKDWAELSNEYKGLEELHKTYQNKLSELITLQKKCLSGVNHQKYRLKAVQKMMSHVNPSNDEEKAVLDDLEKDVFRRKAQLSQMEDSLPRESGSYLKIILGTYVNVSILDKERRFNYKDQYEQFKLIVNVIAFGLALSNLYFESRLLDLVFMFLVVWYYCTLTIRESILKINGSRIKGWWRAHHFLSTALGGVLLVWPDGECYQLFRDTFMWFIVYVTFLQYLQYKYQRGVLYRLRSLGERNAMDITVEGFHSWMWKGLSFLLPFLYIGYFWQLYNAYTLYNLSFLSTSSWQVPILSGLFAILGVGNIWTCSLVIPGKIREARKGLVKLRFTRLDKYFWNHKKRRSMASSRYGAIIDRILKRGNLRTDSMSSTTSSSAEDSKKES